MSCSLWERTECCYSVTVLLCR